MAAAYAAVSAHLDERETQFNEEADDELRAGAVTEMRNLVRRVRGLQRTIAWAEAAARPPLDLGSTYFLDEAAEALLHVPTDVVVVAGSEKNYATITNPLRSNIEEWNGQAPDETVVVIFVPRREQHSGLLHPLVVHELGHAAVQLNDLVDRVLEAAPEGLQDRLIKTAEKVAPLFTSHDINDALRAMMEWLRNWVEEALCDALAAAYLGPTYLYCFTGMVATQPLDHMTHEHPATRQRIELILAQLDAGDWSTLMAAEAPDLDEWLRNIAAARPEIPSDVDDATKLVFAFLTTELEYLTKAVIQTAEEQVGDRRFDPGSFKEVADEVKVYIENAIPPAQSMISKQAIQSPAILLGGWLHALHNGGGTPACLAEAPGLDELTRLLPKALELRALLEAWKS